MSKYRDIVDFINNEIEMQNIKYGEKMPTIRELSEKFKCSKQTVVHAYEALQSEHIVYSIPQSGYYLVDKKEIRKTEANKIIDLTAGSPDESIFPYEDFQHCLNQAIDIYKASLFDYSSPKGLESLIKVLKIYFEDYQIFCPEDDIFITSGSQQAINILCSMPFPNGKNNVLVEQPTYNGVLKICDVMKTPVIGIERKFNGLDFDELERKFANGNVKCFYTIPRFSNPLGISYTNEEKKRIVDLAEKYDVYIIEDDYLGDLEFKNNSFPMYYTDVSAKVIYVKSFSKILLPGLRVAAVVLPRILQNAFYDYKSSIDLNTGVLSQGALEIYIKSGMFKANKKIIKKIYSDRMKIFKKLINEIEVPNVKWHVPDTGFYACMEFLSKINMKRLIKECEKRGILIMDMEKYYLKDYFMDDILKISVSKLESKYIKKSILEIVSAIKDIQL